MTRTARATLAQARLDPETARTLERLRRTTGLSDSELLRRGLRLLGAVEAARGGGRKIVGLGRFSSGIEDLGSNKQHLAGFGGS